MATNRNTFRARLPLALAALALVTSACTADATDDVSVDNAPSSLAITNDSSTVVASEAAADANASLGTTTSSTAASTSTAPSTTASLNTTTTIGGTWYDVGPAAGEILDVVGVRYDDVLNVRDQADVSGAIVATAAPFAANPQLVSGGEGLLFNPNGGAWWKVTVNGTQAWASSSFLGQISPNATDLLPQLTADMASTTAPDLNTLIVDIGAALADGPTPSVVLSTEPVGLDAIGSEATIDVINIGDLSIKGWRIQIQFNNVFDGINGQNPQIIGFELVSATGFPVCQKGAEAGTGACF